MKPSTPLNNHKKQIITSCAACGSETLKPARLLLDGDGYICPECGMFHSPAAITQGTEDMQASSVLIPASPSENNEKVFLHSKKKLFLKGIKTIESILGDTERRKGKKLLDIGCGFGYFIKLAQNYGWTAEGVEISQTAVEYCRRELSLDVHSKPLKELNLPSEIFDAVTMWGVLDLVPSPSEEIKEINRILKPGGVLFIRVNNFSFHLKAYLLGQISILKHHRVAPGIIHRYGITSKALKKLLTASGFRDVKVFNSPPTEGDPYGTGGVFGGFFVQAFKKIYFIASEIIYCLTLGAITISSSLMAIALKK